MKNVLITGASGFIGNRIGSLFLEKGYHVTGWDRNTKDSIFVIQKIDMLNEKAMIEGLDQLQPDIIIHCAGSADVGKSVKDPAGDYQGNVTVTHNLLFALHKCGLERKRLVFLSSAGVYGNPTSLPITEDMLLNPLSPYAVHKVMCEDLCHYFIKNYGADIKIARIFSAYGVGLRKQIFWDMHNKLKSTGELKMFGTGNESRDYINIEDVIKAIYLLAVSDTDEYIFNVANGEEVTIREATEYFADAAGVNIDCISFNGVVREGDPLNWRADISRLQRLGYKKTTDIKSGLENYLRWIRDEL